MSEEITIKLNEDEFWQLLQLMSYALGAAMGKGDMQLAGSFIHMANVVNRDNPNWTPYVIPTPKSSVAGQKEGSAQE